MDLQVLGVHPFDRAAPMNCDVIADELVGTSVGVTYQDAESGTVYIYLTNLPVSVPPGLVALLYESRWEVEKVFDEFKNKLGETKSWASPPMPKPVSRGCDA